MVRSSPSEEELSTGLPEEARERKDLKDAIATQVNDMKPPSMRELYATNSKQVSRTYFWGREETLHRYEYLRP